MSLKYGLLGLLNNEQMTGYELDKAFKKSLDFFWQAQPSQIYRELNNMEKSGWLTSEFVFQTDKPNKKLYSITDLGKLELHDWLTQNSLDSEFKIRSVFLMKLFFSDGRSVRENMSTLEAYKIRCMDELADSQKTDNIIGKNQDNVYWRLTVRFEELYIKACLDFAAEAIKTLEELQ